MTTGYLVLPQLFTATEVGRLRDAAEQVHAEVVAAAESGETKVTVWPDGRRLEEIRGTTIHWEPDAPGKAVRSLAPVSQLHPALTALWTEPRLTTPMSSIIGAPAGPFVSKLIPGSQLDGPAPRDPLEPTGLLVDRSAPNRTATDRRSLLFCFQPAGRPELSALTYDAERLADLP